MGLELCGTASYPALRAPLLPQSLAAAAAGPARGYSQESKTTYLEDLPPLPEYELPPSKLGEEVDDVYLIRAQGLPWSCTVEDVLSFFSGILYVCFKYVTLGLHCNQVV